MAPDDAVAAAARMLLNDLTSTGCLSRATKAALDRSVAARRGWVAAWPAGVEHVVGLVAQDLQEAIHAQLDPQWPTCPEHRDHALVIEPDLGPDPFWVCEVSGLPVASVGGL